MPPVVKFNPPPPAAPYFQPLLWLTGIWTSAQPSFWSRRTAHTFGRCFLNRPCPKRTSHGTDVRFDRTLGSNSAGVRVTNCRGFAVNTQYVASQRTQSYATSPTPGSVMPGSKPLHEEGARVTTLCILCQCQLLYRPQEDLLAGLRVEEPLPQANRRCTCG